MWIGPKAMPSRSLERASAPRSSAAVAAVGGVAPALAGAGLQRKEGVLREVDLHLTKHRNWTSPPKTQKKHGSSP